MIKDRIIHGIYLILEKLLHCCISPYLRAFILRILGATIGKNVRINEIKLFNLMRGFKNLIIGDDVHIGTDTLIDLHNKVIIKKGAVISPRVLILTHNDPGSYHNSPLCKIYPPKTMPVEIGSYSWLGASVTIACGVKIGDKAVIGANSLVNCDIPANTLACGLPAKVIKEKLLHRDINFLKSNGAIRGCGGDCPPRLGGAQRTE